MTCYFAVKLTRIGNDGKENPNARTYGLIEMKLAPPDMSHPIRSLNGDQKIGASLHLTHTNLSSLGYYYGNEITDGRNNPSDTALSFRPTFDIIQRYIGPDRQIAVYKVEGLTVKEQEKFCKATIDELVELGYA